MARPSQLATCAVRSLVHAFALNFGSSSLARIVLQVETLPATASGYMRTTREIKVAPEFDFLAHLSERMGVDRESVKDALGQWLIHFEPTGQLADELSRPNPRTTPQ